jgi:hypothetical protein
MLMERFELVSLWPLRSCRRSFGFLCLLFTLIFISGADCVAQSDQVVAREQKAFFEAWLRRELRGDELRKVTDEFIAFFAKKGKDRAGIHEATKQFLEYAKFLREHDGAPLAFTLRHRLIEANYFDPDMQNTTELRLLTEPDPVRVVDPGGKYLMTEKEVVALANLLSFSNSDEEPRSKAFSRQKIDSLAIELDRAFGNYPKANRMPRYFRETAALWAGIRREWPKLSAEQKRQVRAYAAKGSMAPMDDYKLYGKLLDLNIYEAFGHWNYDVTTAMMKIQGDLWILNSIQNEMRKVR